MKVTKSVMMRAENGDHSAQCLVAESLMLKETRHAYSRALPWLRRAAASGEPWAEYHIGLIYDHGLTGRRDRRCATRWYERAASKGYASAQLNLGILLANRRGRFRDLTRAVDLYRLAARQGRASTAYNLALYYAEGRGVPKNATFAKRWYERAAALGDRDAQRILKSWPNKAMQADALKDARG